MSNTNISSEIIELALPVNPAYVSAARLTASSIANRMRFDIEDIEDIKAAVSEACTYLIRKNAHTDVNTFNIVFILKADCLEINLKSKNINSNINKANDEELGIMMIQALMDEVDIREDPKTEPEVKLNMLKKLK